ncbi:PAS domain S-box protein [candidate division KSB1 bacterium]|nr:PAS domain S-box protein [candidate division KSB1 bacterium]
MDSSFKTPSINKKFQLDAKIVIPMTLLLAFILIISAVLDIFGSRHEMFHILEEQSRALLTALEKGSHNALQSWDMVQTMEAQRLLDNARLLERLDFAGLLRESDLTAIAEKNNIFRINFYNSDGEKEFTSFRGFGYGANKNAPADLMLAIKQQGNDELILGFRSGRLGTGQRFAVAKRRRKGGVIVLNVNSDDMLEFRKSIGLGRLIRDIGENKGIEYIVLQNLAGVLIATAEMDSISSIPSDKFLSGTLESNQPATRFTSRNGRKYFEIVYPFETKEKQLLRIGLNISHLKQAQKSAMLRIVLSSLLLLIFGGVAANWIISARHVKSLQEAYQRIQTYTGSILANMTDAVIAVNGRGKITLINHAAERLFNISAANSYGKECTQAVSALCPYLQTGLKDRASSIYHQENLSTPNGEVNVFISVNIVKNNNGEIEAVFAVIRDLTEQTRLEENLKRRDQITAMGHLASGVAHEIRNPLNAISMIAQRFKNEFTPQKDEQEYGQMAETIVEETRRINDIIRQFLQFARPSQPVKNTVDLEKLIDTAATLIRQPAEAKGVDIFQNCRNLPPILADADKLQQAFLNLAQNALDACNRGDSMTFSCQKLDKTVRIKISDTGNGMSEKELTKIFNLYYTTKEHGTGIGLSVVQQIISLHDGTIQVQSRPGKGTDFIITLPVAM